MNGPDVARLLGQRPCDMYRMIDSENIHTHNVRMNSGVMRECVSLSEAGFYQVVMLSRTEASVLTDRGLFLYPQSIHISAGRI